MPNPTIAPYGSWRSPISADLLASGGVSLGQIALVGGAVLWSEGRPAEGGRQVVVRREPNGATVELVPAPFNARTRVHEYGGGAFVPLGDGLVFANFADQRLYRVDGPGGAPRPLTPETGGALRYADFAVDQPRNRLIGVREDHRDPGREAVNTLAAVALAGDEAGGTVLVAGNDFYAAPRLSPDGTRLAWLTWSHPHMPWDGCALWLAAIAPDGALRHPRRIAGGGEEAIFQPEWSPAGELHVVSDRTGWWNLYRWDEPSGELVPLCPRESEFGLPQWVFGQSTYAFLAGGRIACAWRERRGWRLGLLDPATGDLTDLDLPYTDITQVRAAGTAVCFLAGSPTQFRSVVRLDLATGEQTVLRRARETALDPGYLSIPEPIAFPTTGGQTAYGFFYPPRNRDYVASPGERPPLIVESHGGPTAGTDTTLNLSIQFWTSRGFAVLDVDYGGSTGYGTTYRRRLDGTWGITDVDDCVHGARYLVERGLVDGNRLAIRGGSASGYTTLAALTFRDLFKAGESHYGVSDLEALALETHKFESHYLDRLIGPYPAARDLYIERSPIHHVERLNCPLILFQGLEDKVVPPNQAEKMAEAAKAKGLPVAYVAFPGEQHGFRQAATIKGVAEAALYFYSRVFGFELPEPVEPVPIANL